MTADLFYSPETVQPVAQVRRFVEVIGPFSVTIRIYDTTATVGYAYKATSHHHSGAIGPIFSDGKGYETIALARQAAIDAVESFVSGGAVGLDILPAPLVAVPLLGEDAPRNPERGGYDEEFIQVTGAEHILFRVRFHNAADGGLVWSVVGVDTASDDPIEFATSRSYPTKQSALFGARVACERFIGVRPGASPV